MWKGSLLLLLVPLAAGKFEYGSSCRQLECLPKERLIEQLKHYQSQKKRTAVPVVVQTKPRSWPSSRLGQLDELPEDDNPTCNICSSTPCQNGGTCAVDPQSPWNKYTCTCPGNTKGDRCEIPVTCVPETCGPGANCYVSNHQTNCVCPLGYAGNPNDPTVGCSQQIVEACADGDPHYVTFDGFHFDYMGTCPSIFSRPCTSLTGGYADYQVVTKAELVGTTHVSVAHELEVTMYAQKIHMDAEKTLLHNGIAVNPPFYWPSQAAPNITVTFDGSTFTVVNNQYVTVTFSTGGRFCVRVPNVPEFQGPNTLCGLAGNLDGNALNDVVHRDGTVFPVTTEETQARYPPPEKADAFNACEDEWITQEFTSSTASTSCATGQQLSNNTNCDVMPAINTCSAIQQAVNGTGPFGMCQAMGAAQIQNYYDNCVFDLCQQDTLKCHVFENFVKSCQTNLPNTDVGGWRNTEGCPAVCAPGSHYSSCTSSCPATCADQKRPDTCNQGCFEGCECDSGSVVDNTNLMGMSCIPIGQCGCTDPNGNLHPAGQPWLDSNCTVLAECLNGTYTSSATECSGYGYCGTDGQHRMACHCLSGFEGDGFNCTDIDECLDSASCGQAQGLAAYSAVEVYCDMSQFGGGWTLLSHDSGSGMANRTFDEYSAGFGTGTDRWLGLEFAHQMTELQNTSLLLGKILRCGYGFWDDTVSDCTYPQFTVLDANRSYAVYIPEPCRGTDKQYTGAFDGWVRWDRTQIGPSFQTFDRDTTAPKCSTVHKTVGFWYPTSQKDLCGPANLNGFRTSCSAPAPDQKHLEPFDQYGSVLIADAWMYLRPRDYTPPAASTTLPPPPPPPATDTPAPPAEPVATEAPPPPPAPPVTDAAATPL